MPLPDLSLPIVGADFPNKKGPGRRFELAMCKPGEPVDLRPEPNNPADEHAVAVFSCRGIQLGYIPSERAVRVSQLIRQGAEPLAIFHMLTKRGGLIRVTFDGNMPDLPPDLGDGQGEPDFWPDDEWPDD